MEPEIREFRPGDLPDLSRVFREAFQAELRPPEWAWKYGRAPFRGASLVALVDGRAEGFFGAWATRFRGAGGNLPGVAAVDVMTSRAARTLRRHGAFASLATAFFDANGALGAPFVFGFPNDRHRKTGERLLSYVEVERCGEWERPGAGPAPLRARFRRVVRGEPFGRAHESLAEALHARPGWRSDRSAASLNWRFRERPGVDYEAVQLLRLSGRSRGYAVVRREGPVARIVDLQVFDEAGGDLPDLLAALASSRTAPPERWLVRAPRTGPLAGRLTHELGFEERASDCSFTVRRLRDGFDVGRAAATFDYRFSDHDVF